MKRGVQTEVTERIRTDCLYVDYQAIVHTYLLERYFRAINCDTEWIRKGSSWNGEEGELRGTIFCGGVESSRKLLSFVATEGENEWDPLSNLIIAIGISI